MDISTLGEDLLKVVLKEVILRFKKHYTSEVDNGLDEAFRLALADWSKHAPTTSEKVRLSKALEEYIQTSTSYEALDADTRAFIDCFKKRLSEQTAAHNYLMTLRADMQAKSEERNLLEHHKTQVSVLDLKSRMEELNMAPQYVRALLKELPLEQGQERTELALEEMLTNGRIHSEGAKRLVLEFVRFLFERTSEIAEEAKRLREAGDSDLAKALEEINRVLTGESEQSLAAVYEKYKEQAKQNEIRVLKELIEAAQIKFTFGEARKFYERLIELSPTIEHHFNYAYLLQNLNDFDKARCHYEEVLQVLRELSKKDPGLHKPNLATTLNNLGNILVTINELRQAQTHYEEALQIRRELAEEDPETYKPNVVASLNNLGILLSTTKEYKQAQTFYKEALWVLRELSKKNPELYKPNVVTILNNLGALLIDTNEHKQAQTYYEEALEVSQELAKYNPQVYNSYVATTLNHLGTLLSEINEHKQAQTYYEEALQKRRELAKYNPEAYEPDVATTLNNLGILLKNTNEYKQAQTYYEEALEIRRGLAEHNPEVYKPYVAITLNNIGNLLCDTNELQQAQACYKEALQKYRELPEHSLEVYKPDMAMVLNNLGILLKNTNELQQAQSCYEEALKIHQESAKHNQETYKPDLATTQQNLTLLYLQQGKKEEAEEAYQEAYDIYQDLASHYPRAYGIDYAQLLVIGFDLLGKPKKYLEEAKAILDKYPEHPKAQELLSIIEQLDKR